MNIALVLNRFDPSWGGLEAWTCHYAQWLARSGHRVQIVAFVIDPSALAPGIVPVQVKRPRPYAARAAALANAARQLHPEIIHDTGCVGCCDIYHLLGGTRLASRRAESPARPLTQRWREFLVPRWRQWYRAQRHIEERAFADPRVKLVAVSRMVHDQLISLHRADPARITIVHNGIDTGRFSTLGRDSNRRHVRAKLGAGDAIVFLQVAQNFVLKGADAVLRAMAIIAKERPGAAVQYWLAGDGPIERYRQKVRRLRISNHVRFLGYVDDLRPLYHAADAMVHPAHYDPCPLSSLEAMASGLPVITTPLNGASEMITDGVDGFIVPNPDDARTLSIAMGAHWTPQGWAHMGRIAAQRSNRFRDVDQFAKIASLYDQAMSERSLSSR